jgi:serine phosphatase RsbU (regulator of sigma subunit)
MIAFAWRLLIVLLVVSPLMAGGLWIYEASAAAFSQQHAVREAQLTRGSLVRILLEKESDVRGYAATSSPFFLQQFSQDGNAFEQTEAHLVEEIHNIDPAFDEQPIRQEIALYHRWVTTVAQPIFERRRGSLESLLRQNDRRFSAQFLVLDTQVTTFLDDAVSLSELHRQQLLRRILLASIGLVISAAFVVSVLMMQRERADRARFVNQMQLEKEQRLSDKLQRSLTPDRLPKIDDITLQAMYVPAAFERLVGGDWYDVLELPGHRLLCIIGDVGGHGLDAAAFMNRARQSLVASALIETDPAAMLLRTNQSLVDLNSPLVTAVCAILDVPRMELRYAIAGHPPPILVRRGAGAVILQNGGPPLGIIETIPVESHAVTLESGDCLFFYTDGLLENDRDVIAGEALILEKAFYAAEKNDSASALYQGVIGETKPKDDVAVLAIQIA